MNRRNRTVELSNQEIKEIYHQVCSDIFALLEEVPQSFILSTPKGFISTAEVNLGQQIIVINGRKFTFARFRMIMKEAGQKLLRAKGAQDIFKQMIIELFEEEEKRTQHHNEPESTSSFNTFSSSLSDGGR